MATAGQERKLDESRGAFHERLGVAIMALEHLDVVITPLEDKVAGLNRTYGARSPRDEGLKQTVDVLMGVVRVLRRGPAIGAMTEVSSGISEVESIIALDDVNDGVALALEEIIEEDSKRRFRSSFNEGTIMANSVYPTLAKTLYVQFDRFKGTNNFAIVAARSEEAAHQRITQRQADTQTS